MRAGSIEKSSIGSRQVSVWDRGVEDRGLRLGHLSERRDRVMDVARQAAERLIGRSPDYRRLWGLPDDDAWERALDWYLDRYAAFSDIQEARPRRLAELELT